MADFDLNKLKNNVGGLVGSIKSMISPAAGTPQVDADDALGLKIAQLTTLVKQLTDAQHEHVRNLERVNEMLNGIFHDIGTLRAETKVAKEAVPEKPVEAAATPAVPEIKAEATVEEKVVATEVPVEPEKKVE